MEENKTNKNSTNNQSSDFELNENKNPEFSSTDGSNTEPISKPELHWQGFVSDLKSDPDTTAVDFDAIKKRIMKKIRDHKDTDTSD